MNESSELKLFTYYPLNPCKIRALFSSRTANFSWHLLLDKAVEKTGAKVQEQSHVNKTQILGFETDNSKTGDPMKIGWISLNREMLRDRLWLGSWRMVKRRNYSTSKVINLDKDSGELESKLISQAMELLNNKIWPTENIEFKLELDRFIERENALVAIRVVQTFIPKDALSVKSGILEIIRYVKRSEMQLENKSKWSQLMELAGKQMSSLLYKIKSIENISHSNGRYTPGVDGKCFKTLPRKAKNEEEAIKSLEQIIRNVKFIISTAKGKTDQAIARKGLAKLTEHEKQRRYLKTSKGRIEVREQRLILKDIKKDPLKYLEDLRKETIKHNNKLKFACLKELKNYRLHKYKSKDILRVMIPKSNNKLRPLGILTLRDRSVQMLLKIVMEPYLEPLGDQSSFGFRPGRNSFQAINILYNYLIWKESNISADGLSRVAKRDLSMRTKLERSKLLRNGDTYYKQTTANKKEFYVTKWVLDADIESCSGSISHTWLIENVPMPKNYENLLVAILKTRVVERSLSGLEEIIKPENNNYGIPQGGIISPMLMNWALDGMEDVCIDNAYFVNANGAKIITYVDPDKVEFYDRNNLFYKRKSDLSVNLKRNTHFIRYADDFLVITSSEEAIGHIKTAINEYLKHRGLILSEEKTKKIKWMMNNKLDFLGWTFHLINPRKINWITQANRTIAGKLSDWRGLYVYPSRKSTSNFRTSIKNATSISEVNKNVDNVFKSVINIIVGWSNYFSPGPKQTYIRHHLDKYVFDRIRKFLRKKYAKSYPLHFKKYFQNKDGTLRKYISIIASERKTLINDKKILTPIVRIMSDRELKIPKLTELHTDSNLGIFNPPISLRHNSMYLNPTPYIKYYHLISSVKKELKPRLLFYQKELCTICNKPLVNWNKYMTESIMDDLFFKRENYKLNDSEPKIGIKQIKREFSGLHIDHVIPVFLANGVLELKEELNRIENLNLVHSECHKIKTSNDKFIYKEFLKIKRRLTKRKGMIHFNENDKKYISGNIILEISKITKSDENVVTAPDRISIRSLHNASSAISGRGLVWNSLVLKAKAYVAKFNKIE